MITHSIEIELLLSGLVNVTEYHGKGLSVTETTEVHHKETVLPSCVTILYRFQGERQPSVALPDYLNQIVPTLADDLFSCLMLLLPRPVEVIGQRFRCDGQKASVTVARPEPAQLYILAGMWNRNHRNLGLCYAAKPELWSELEAVFLAYQALGDPLRRRLRMAMNWLSKAAGETTGPDRLVAAWIAFNAIYADPTIRSERDAIQSVIHRNIDTVIAAQYVKANEYYIKQIVKYQLELRNGTGTRRVDLELATQLGIMPPDANSIIAILILCIYSARNRLFHGAVDLSIQEEHLLSEAAEVPLCNLVQILIFKSISGHHLKTHSFATNASYGF